jgi:hypothetical protein
MELDPFASDWWCACFERNGKINIFWDYALVQQFLNSLIQIALLYRLGLWQHVNIVVLNFWWLYRLCVFRLITLRCLGQSLLENSCTFFSVKLT